MFGSTLSSTSIDVSGTTWKPEKDLPIYNVSAISNKIIKFMINY